MIPLVEETIVKPIIKEAEQKDLPPGVLCRGSWLTCNVGKLNANKRVYEKAVWDRVISDKDIAGKIANRAAFGEGEHPKETASDLMRTSHVVTGMRFAEAQDGGLDLYSDIDILDTPSGRIINTLIKAGCGVGVSTRAEGDLEESENDEFGKFHRVIPEAYEYKATDFTADPSTYGSAPHNVQVAVMHEAMNGVKEAQMPKAQAIAILENLKLNGNKEDKALLESSLKALKEQPTVKIGMPAIVFKATKEAGVEEQKQGKVIKIKEATITIELEDGTTISTETIKLTGDHVEVTLPDLVEGPLEELPMPGEEETGLLGGGEKLPGEIEAEPEPEGTSADDILSPDEDEFMESKTLEKIDYFSILDHLAERMDTLSPELQLGLRNQVKAKLLGENVVYESTKVIRRLKISESSAKAERDEAISILEEAEKRLDSMEQEHSLQLTIATKKLSKKLAESSKAEVQTEIDTLAEQLKGKDEELTELRTIIKEAKKQHALKVSTLKEQYDKEISEKIQEIETQSSRKIVDNYIDLKLSTTGLAVHRNTRALLGKCNSIKEVDEVFEEIKEAMRRDALRPTPAKDHELPDKDSNAGINETIKRSVRTACKGL